MLLRPRRFSAVLINIYAAWIGFLLGACSGFVPGLFFHREDWLGGYNSWTRRLLRLGHISFFGIGFLNLAFGLTSRVLGIDSGLLVPSLLLLVAAVTMPLVCYLSAWKTIFRNFFFIPVGSVTVAIGVFLFSLR
jgi:hypothetical protein